MNKSKYIYKQIKANHVWKQAESAFEVIVQHICRKLSSPSLHEAFEQLWCACTILCCINFSFKTVVDKMISDVIIVFNDTDTLVQLFTRGQLANNYFFNTNLRFGYAHTMGTVCKELFIFHNACQLIIPHLR